MLLFLIENTYSDEIPAFVAIHATRAGAIAHVKTLERETLIRDGAEPSDFETVISPTDRPSIISVGRRHKTWNAPEQHYQIRQVETRE